MNSFQKTCTNVAYLERFGHVNGQRKKNDGLRENDLFQFNNSHLRCCFKMSACSSCDACTKCTYRLRSGDRVLQLQNSSKLCHFVFSSGAIDLTKLIDLTQLHIPLCSRCYQSLNRLYKTSTNTREDVSMEEMGTNAECNISFATQLDDLCLTSFVRSKSFNMIVDPPTSLMPVLTSASKQPPIQVHASTIPSIVLPFYRLTKSNNRRAVCGDYFPSSDFSVLQIDNDIRARAFFEHSILIMTLSRCCNKHVSNGYFTTAALRAIERKENTYEASLEELMDTFNGVKSEYSQKASVVEESSNVSPLDFDSPNRLTSDNYYVLTGLNRIDFDNLCSYLPPVSLRNTPNRTACTAVARLLMKLRLGISYQVLATLFSFPDRRTVARTIHSAHKALVEQFVLRFLDFEHVSREEFVNMHTCSLAAELLADYPDGAILILDGTYIYCQKSANNMLQRRTYSTHKGRSLVKPMLVVTTIGYIVLCLGPYFADYQNNEAEITKYIVYSNEENINQRLEKSDIIVIDRGFRDALDYLQKYEYRKFMPAFLDRSSKQFPTRIGNETRIVTKIRWIIESANGRIKQWRIFDKVLPNSLLKSVGDLVAIVCALQNAYGAPFIKSTLKDKMLAENMLRLRNETNELADFVVRLKEKSEKPPKLAELNAADTVSDFPRLNLEEVHDLTFNEANNQLYFLFLNRFFIFLGIYQLKQEKSYTIEHWSADGKYSVKIEKHRPDIIIAKIQSRQKNSTSYDVWIRYSTQ